jgi:succinate dehydrogenase/fumarate reductase flavoprotein subunit
LSGDLVVAGAGMAGLAAAARARELGARVALLEAAPEPGGSMRWSSGVFWRHRQWGDLRAECPDGDEALQRRIWEGFDAALAWLVELGAPVVHDGTGNPRTTGARLDPAGLTRALVDAAGGAELGARLTTLPRDVPVILATGGFHADRDLLARHVTPEAEHLLIRGGPCSRGDGLRLGLDAGGTASSGLDEIYGRAMPAPPARIEPADWVALSQLYARHADVVGADGERHEARTWSEIDVVQWLARRPGAAGTFRVSARGMGERVRERTVSDMVAAAEAAGAPVRRDAGGGAEVDVRAAVTTTLGGLRTDADGRVADGVWAAGADAGGWATGGWASGLGAALVMGRAAAEAALAG